MRLFSSFKFVNADVIERPAVKAAEAAQSRTLAGGASVGQSAKRTMTIRFEFARFSDMLGRAAFGPPPRVIRPKEDNTIEPTLLKKERNERIHF